MKKFIIKKVEHKISKRLMNKNNINENINNMTTDEKIEAAQEILSSIQNEKNVKHIKKDKGLIERTESSKIVLNEDNKQLLND